MPPSSGAYILCRPQGGINDCLVQIEACCAYGERHGRAVVVDTAYTGSRFFRDTFAHYFRSRNPALILDATDWIEPLNRMSVHPRSLAGRLHCYQATTRRIDTKHGVRFFYADESGQPLHLDFRRPYTEQVLVHHALGGGTRSLMFFTRVELADELKAEILRRLMEIGGIYDSIHVRNTDYRSDYRTLFSERVNVSERPVFLGTDSQEVLDTAREILGNARVHSFSSHLSIDGSPIHRDPEDQLKRTLNRDTILDLLMLALGHRYRYAKLKSNKEGVQVSGFSRLASGLHLHRGILQQTIGIANERLDNLLWPREY